MDYMNISEIYYSDSNNITWNELGKDRLQAQEVVAVVIYIIVFVVGVPGNALVLWVTVSGAQRSVNAIWFLNLAVADLLSCLALPIQIVTVMHHTWPLGKKICPILHSFFDLNLYASILLLTTISADRFLIVFRPIWCQKYRVAWLAWLASGMAWILALMFAIPSFMLIEFFEDSLSKKTFCGVVLSIDGNQVKIALAITLFALSFLVPLVTMSVCYSFLLFRTWRRSTTRFTKTLKVVLAMVISFFVFSLPGHVSYMVSFLAPKYSPSFKLALSLNLVCMALAYVNCCINPIIYVATAPGLHIRVFKFQLGQLHQLLTEDETQRTTTAVHGGYWSP